MENMKKITYLELLQMIKEDKEPKTIITKSDGENHKYTYGGGSYTDKDGRSFKEDWCFVVYSPCGHATEPFIYYEDEILDNAEKRYLKGVIRPFRDNVKVIIKSIYPSNLAKGSEFIRIVYKDNSNTNLPPFPSKYMYARMELGRCYTLEELDI